MSAGAAPWRGRPVPALLLSVLLLVVLTAATPNGAATVPHAGEDDGMGLLRGAAKSRQETAYQGVQSVSVHGGGETLTEEAEVVYRPGEGVGYADTSPEAPLGEWSLVVGRSLSLPGLDERLLRTLERNYRVTRSGTDAVGGRDATVVEARRADETVAGRFWIDDRTFLPLRREVYGTSGDVAHSSRFRTLEVGGDTTSLPEAPGADEGRGESLSGPERERLAVGDWTVPDSLAWNLRLVEARTKDTADGRVVHLSYSDGLSIVSVFVQRGRLGAEPAVGEPGMRRVVDRGGTAYVDDSGKYRRVWEADGFVYTVLSDAPLEVVGPGVEALPAPDASGVWARVQRGFERLGSRIVGTAGG